MSKEKSASLVREQSVLQFLFSKKYKDTDKILQLMKSPRFWGALMGELIGTMLLTIVFMTTIGVFRADLVPIFLFGAIVTIYIATYSLSGAHLNPLITAGAMATRRVSVVKGLFYMIMQFVGAWLGFFILMLFKNGSGSSFGIPVDLVEVNDESFWPVFLIELMCAMILGFAFARVSSIKRNRSLSYAIVMTCCVAFIFLLGIIISQDYFGLYASLVFNPASASAYPVFADITGGIGQVSLVLLAYFVVPMIGGVIGTFISDLATRLVGDGYVCDDEE